MNGSDLFMVSLSSIKRSTVALPFWELLVHFNRAEKIVGLIFIFPTVPVFTPIGSLGVTVKTVLRSGSEFSVQKYFHLFLAKSDRKFDMVT